MRLKEVRMKERGVRKKACRVGCWHKHGKNSSCPCKQSEKSIRHIQNISEVILNILFMILKNRCQIGDKVRIIESRPISKKKRWQVIDIIEKG